MAGLLSYITLEPSILLGCRATLQHTTTKHQNKFILQSIPLYHRTDTIMFGRTLTSWLILLFSTVGILPGQSRCWNWLGFLAWLVLTAIASTAYCYEVYLYFAFIPSIPGLLMLMNLVVLPPLQMVGCVFTLARTGTKIPGLVKSSNLPIPCVCMLLAFVTASWCWMCYGFLQSQDWMLALSMELFGFLCWTNIFMLGASVSLLCENLKKKDFIVDAMSAKLIATDIISDCKSLRSYLSPMCFILFFVQTGVLISNGYSSLSCKSMKLLPELIFSVFSMLYACLVVHLYFDQFKSMTEKLRLRIYIAKLCNCMILCNFVFKEFYA